MRPRAEPQFREKTWRISVVLNKRSERFSVERETICSKGRHCLPKEWSKSTPAAAYVGRAEIGAAWSMPSRGGLRASRSSPDDPSFNAPIYANLFDDEGGERSSLARGGRKNWLRTASPPPRRLATGGLPRRRSSASTPCRQRKPRRGKRRPHARPAKALRSATGREPHDSQRWRREQRMRSRSQCARSTTGSLRRRSDRGRASSAPAAMPTSSAPITPAPL